MKSIRRMRNRKRAVILIGVFIFIALIIAALPRVELGTVQTGTTYFKQEEEIITETLSDDDLNTIAEIFQGKVLYNDVPSHGFSNKVSVVFNESQYFCIARDGSPIIFWGNKGKYFKISKSEYTVLESILEKYGFYFPCI